MVSVRLAWWLLPLIALTELGLHGLIRARVPSERDFEAAAAFVRSEFRPRDALAAAPSWADPILRQHLGDRIPLAMAGRSDLAAYDRFWTLSIRGHRAPEVAASSPELTRVFGGVTVLRYVLPPASVGYDLVAHLFDASVEQGPSDRAQPCPFLKTGPSRGGGLGKGVIAPRRRFSCESKDPRGFVAPVVIEDLDLAPRYCVFQPALARGPMRVTFPAVPLADVLVFHGGLYYEDERMRHGAPVTMRVVIDGEERGRMVHRDGEGWKRLAVSTSGMGTARVVVEVTSKRPKKRGFCWSGSVREKRP